MKKGILVIGIIIFTVSCSAMFGCDRINKLFEGTSPKTPPKVTTAAPAPTEETPQGTKLAKVNSKIITYEEFEQNIKNLKALAPDYKIDSFETRKELLNQMINQELLYQEAKSRGIQSRKEVKELFDAFLRRAVVEQLLIDTAENVTVDAQEIETFYNQYKDQLAEPEQRRVREIVVSSEDRARDALIALYQGQDFATLAKERSIGDSSSNAGDIGFIVKGQRGSDYAKYDEIVFSLDKGQPSSIFQGPQGYYIVKVEDIKEQKSKLLTDVWEDVKKSLLELKQRQRVQDLTDKLRGGANVEIVEELLQ